MKQILILFLLVGTAFALNLTYSECINATIENVTYEICAPPVMTIDAVYNLTPGSQLVMPTWNLTVNAEGCPICNVTVIENITIVNVTNVTVLNVTNVTVMNVTNVTATVYLPKQYNLTINQTCPFIYYNSEANITIYAAGEDGNCQELSNPDDIWLDYSQAVTIENVAHQVVHAPPRDASYSCPVCTSCPACATCPTCSAQTTCPPSICNGICLDTNQVACNVTYSFMSGEKLCLDTPNATCAPVIRRMLDEQSQNYTLASMDCLAKIAVANTTITQQKNVVYEQGVWDGRAQAGFGFPLACVAVGAWVLKGWIQKERRQAKAKRGFPSDLPDEKEVKKDGRL